MSGIICKIWTSLLKLFNMAVEAVASAVKTLGSAVVDVLGELMTSAGNALSSILGGGAGSLLLLAVVGFVGYKVLSSDDDDDVARNQGQFISSTNDGLFNG